MSLLSRIQVLTCFLKMLILLFVLMCVGRVFQILIVLCLKLFDTNFNLAGLVTTVLFSLMEI